ncbi:hypothetical protein [Streptomyces sp. NPDC008150]|uniref:hypothetical protein n=1 Tax=Streptomyces sp. NPDC008150 TaxID=3364816 RepID=UPI0036EF801F
MTDPNQADPEDTCRPVTIDGETIRVRGSGDLAEEDQEALTALVRAAKAKMTAEAPDQIGALQNRLRLAHEARREKERHLDDIRRALCNAGSMQDDDPYGHADLADVIRQVAAADEEMVGELNERVTGLDRRAARAEAALDRVRAFADRLNEYAESALRTEHRTIYAAIAADVRAKAATEPVPAAETASTPTD